jgi:2,3-bisphosphoglycerate-independent phosphoglycerate mutase
MYVHVEAPDEAGHMGGVQEKIEAIEHVDEMIGTILDEFYGVIAVLPDHPTPIRIRTHTRDPVPFAIRGREKDNTIRFSEKEAAKGSYGTRDAAEFLSLVFGAK